MTTREWCSNLSLNRTARERETAGMFGGELGASVLPHMLTRTAGRVAALVQPQEVTSQAAEKAALLWTWMVLGM